MTRRIREEVMKATSQLTAVSDMPPPPKDEKRIPKTAVGMRMGLFFTIEKIERLEELIRTVGIEIPVRPDQPNNPLKAIDLNRAHITKLNELLKSPETGSSNPL